MKLSPTAQENKRIYDNAYAKKYFRSKLVTFNRKNPQDMVILDWANSQPEGGNQYIKRLIWEDMTSRQQAEANV